MTLGEHKTDTKKRAFIKLLLKISAFSPLAHVKSSAINEAEHSFASFVVGERVYSREFEEIMAIFRKMRKNFTNFPIENFLRFAKFLPRWFFDEPSIFENGTNNATKVKVNSLTKIRKYSLIKVKKALIFSVKAGIMFPYYCVEKNWEKIGYTGPFVGRGKFTRYPDPQLKQELKVSSGDELSFDVCIVGSGAGGGIASLELSKNFSVAIVEKGYYLKPENFNEREDEMIPKLYDICFDEKFSILVLRGKGLGGSTLHNTALFVKLPIHVFDFWKENGFPISWDEFSRIQDKVFQICGAQKIGEDELNKNAKIAKSGMEKIGLSYSIPYHSRRDCLGVGFCELGCHWNRKFSTLLNFIPEFQKNGGKVFVGMKALFFKTKGRKIEYLVCSRNGGEKIRINAKYFVLSAGALASPIIVRKSFGISKSYHQSLCLHPSTYVIGVFDEPVFGWLGIPISLLSDEFLKTDRGFILMPYFAHPGIFSLAVGGIGKEHRRVMMNYKNIAMLSVLVHDEHSGAVMGEGLTSIKYEPTKKTIEDIKLGIEKSAEILFEAGAKEVILPDVFQVITAKSMAEVKRYIDLFDVFRVPLLSVHPQATLRWQEFLDDEGRLRGFENLWVADASVFPASCGVPPQVSVMAISLFVSERIKHRASV